jgi:suppressor of ftsI
MTVGKKIFGILMTVMFVSLEARGATTRKIPNPGRLPKLRPTEQLHLKDGDTVELTAAFVRQFLDGRWVTRLAYNQQIPGPTLLVQRGSHIKLKLINRSGEPTALHSHGLRVDDKNDGVVGIGQSPIEHGQSMVYDLRFPDEGLYWYHPHMSDEYGQEMGLQGNFLVKDSQTPSVPRVDREEILMIDDLLLVDGELPSFKDGVLSFALMGRYGNKFLINNQPHWQSRARVGDIVRYWLTNSANARPVKIKFDGAKMKLIGADHGFYQTDQLVDSVVLAPSERAIVDVMYILPGKTKILNIGPEKPLLLGLVDVAKIKISDPKSFIAKTKDFNQRLRREGLLKEFAFVRSFLGGKPDVIMRLDASLHGGHGAHGVHGAHISQGGAGHGDVEWEDTMSDMNEMMTDDDVTWRVIDTESGKENMDIQWKFKRGIPAKIRIINDGRNHPMQHPIHFHGQRFVVIARGGKTEENLVWKDTVLVKSGESVDIVLDNQNPGRWMGHCHISEHLGAGMMFGFEVQ